MLTKQFKSKNAVKIAITAVILFHLLAIVLPPLSFQAQGSSGVSPFVGRLSLLVERYSQFLYMNRGYAFFAPDPGPSHLIQVRVQDSKGNREEMLYPDINRQWPRLLYHRYFMLTEYLHEIYRPRVNSSNALTVEDLVGLREERERYDLIRDSYSRHLQSVHGGKQISLRRIEHLLPRYDLYRRDPRPLNDPISYRVLLDTSVVEGGEDRSTSRTKTGELPPSTNDFRSRKVREQPSRDAQ